MYRFIKYNSLSLVFVVLFLASLGGQIVTGLDEYNAEREKEGQNTVGFTYYLSSGHFQEATFENWESEFLQMALFVILTISLRQKGSSESKRIDGKEEVDREPNPRRKNAPWPVKKGGWILFFYKRSLSLALLTLFIGSFILHLRGTWKDENEQLILDGLPTESMMHYLDSNRFWFESFQNWQSEFLSVFAIVILSVFLRQKGSSQSKPVDAPDGETGE